MDKISKQIESTIKYYDQSADQLHLIYENADMSALHSLLLSSLEEHSKILDIGFGSGRDLAFLEARGFDIWGIDPSLEFVQTAKKRFTNIDDHFSKGLLPNLNFPPRLDNTFDGVICIAVWMHISKELYVDSVRAICSLLRPNAKVVISYSITPRVGETERYFEDVDSELLQDLFAKYGCTKILESTNDDGLSDRSIIWKSEVYCYDKS